MTYRPAVVEKVPWDTDSETAQQGAPLCVTVGGNRTGQRCGVSEALSGHRGARSLEEPS